MRVLKREELDWVSGASHVGTPPTPIDFNPARRDNGGHIGWCRGHGNTGESNGKGSGAQLNDGINKHNLNVSLCKDRDLR